MVDADAIKLYSMALEDNVNKAYSQLAFWNKLGKKIYGTIGNDDARRIVEVICSDQKKYTDSLKPDNFRALVKHMTKPGNGYQNNSNRLNVRGCESNREAS